MLRKMGSELTSECIRCIVSLGRVIATRARYRLKRNRAAALLIFPCQKRSTSLSKVMMCSYTSSTGGDVKAATNVALRVFTQCSHPTVRVQQSGVKVSVKLEAMVGESDSLTYMFCGLASAM